MYLCYLFLGILLADDSEEVFPVSSSSSVLHRTPISPAFQPSLFYISATVKTQHFVWRWPGGDGALRALFDTLTALLLLPSVI